MSARFFAEDGISGATAWLSGPEAHHLLHVMRCQVGDRVTLFDGSGAEFAVEVVQLERSRVKLTVLAKQDVDRELPYALTLGVALPKGDRQRWLVEKAVELGVTRLVPLNTARGVAQPTDKAIDRLRRAVIEASKQCGRNRLMEIARPLELLNFVGARPTKAWCWLAHPSPSAISLPDALSRHRTEPVHLAIGPEGGFTEDEIGAAEDCQLVSLGPRILRVETAAIALAAAFGTRQRSHSIHLP